MQCLDVLIYTVYVYKGFFCYCSVTMGRFIASIYDNTIMGILLHCNSSEIHVVEERDISWAIGLGTGMKAAMESQPVLNCMYRFQRTLMVAWRHTLLSCQGQ